MTKKPIEYKKQLNPFAILLKKTVYNHEFGELAIETNNLEECCADLLNWIHNIQRQNGLLPDTKDAIIANLQAKEKGYNEQIDKLENYNIKLHIKTKRLQQMNKDNKETLESREEILSTYHRQTKDRFCLSFDDDGHCYAINIKDKPAFVKLLDSNDDYEAFNNKFEKYRLSKHYSDYSFVDLKEHNQCH